MAQTECTLLLLSIDVLYIYSGGAVQNRLLSCASYYCNTLVQTSVCLSNTLLKTPMTMNIHVLYYNYLPLTVLSHDSGCYNFLGLLFNNSISKRALSLWNCQNSSKHNHTTSLRYLSVMRGIVAPCYQHHFQWHC